jgi:acetate kinase
VVRRRAVDGLAFLGVAVDPQRNLNAKNEQNVTADGGVVQTLVIPAREDLQIASEARSVACS